MDEKHLKVNSNEYWDERFEKDWEIYEGQQQTSFFVNLLIQNLPQWIKEQFVNSIVCDAGCAEGQGTKIFKDAFPSTTVEGIDFSEVAIEKAKLLFPSIHFFKDDVYNLKNNYDSIFISNVLEHFEQPFEVVKSLLKKVNKHLIIMVPFQEVEMLKEHFYRFEYESFPINIGDFSLSYFKEIDCRLLEYTLWEGKQALVIYTKSTVNSSTVRDIHTIQLDEQYVREINVKISEQTAKIQELSDWGASIHAANVEKDKLILELNEKLFTTSSWAKQLDQQIIERDVLILEESAKIEKLSQWGKELENAAIQKDEQIVELNKKIEELSQWGLKLQKEVEQRDSLILNLNEKVQEVSEWALKLQQQNKR